jgi:hypothetical protein
MQGVDAFDGQHTRALECADHERTKRQRCCLGRLVCPGKEVRPPLGFWLGMVIREGKYHTYVMALMADG